MSAVIAASLCFVALSTFSTHRVAKAILEKQYGSIVYQASFFLQDIPIFMSFIACCAAIFVCGMMVLTPHMTNILLLSIIFTMGYYVTFRSLLLYVLNKKFIDILRTRHGYPVSQNMHLDGATAIYRAGGAPSYVAYHLTHQIEVSNKVVLPIGFIWLILLFVVFLYVPLFWLKGLVVSGTLGVLSSFASTMLLLPNLKDGSRTQFQCSSYSSALPGLLFLVIFALTTPFSCSYNFLDSLHLSTYLDTVVY